MRKASKTRKMQWDRRLIIYLDKDMLDWVKTKADQQASTDSGYVRQLLKNEMQKGD